MAGTVIPTLTTDPPTTASSATGPPGPTPAPSPSNRPSSPARDDQPQENGKEKLTYLADNPILNQFLELLPGILSETGHYEMWGVPLKDAYDAPTVNVLIKFLRANDGSVAHAQDQLTKALQWRHEMDPLALMEEKFNRKYEGIGYFAVYEHEGVGHVVTWNVYGAMREGDVTEVFGDVDE